MRRNRDSEGGAPAAGLGKFPIAPAGGAKRLGGHNFRRRATGALTSKAKKSAADAAHQNGGSSTADCQARKFLFHASAEFCSAKRREPSGDLSLSFAPARLDEDRTGPMFGRHQGVAERMRKRRVLEADREKLPFGFAGALPGGFEFDRAGAGPRQGCGSRDPCRFTLRQAENDVAAMQREPVARRCVDEQGLDGRPVGGDLGIARRLPARWIEREKPRPVSRAGYREWLISRRWPCGCATRSRSRSRHPRRRRGWRRSEPRSSDHPA